MALKGNLNGVLGGANLASQLKKLQGKGFANFIAKQSDSLDRKSVGRERV